jgi:endonuclease YncB( thermonuclease family)
MSCIMATSRALKNIAAASQKAHAAQAAPAPAAAAPAQAAAAYAAAGKPADKPDKSSPAAARAAALPDATLLEGEDGVVAVAATAGWRRWLPEGRKRWLASGIGVIVLVLVATAATVTAARWKAPEPEPLPSVIAGLAKAADGATISVNGQTVRLLDIDAPPLALICRDGAWQYRCGDEARRALATAIGSGPVECTSLEPVAGGTFTARCLNEAGLDIAAIQVENGWAVNDIHRSSHYVAEEMRARSKTVGLWRTDFAHPELWRAGNATARSTNSAIR